MSDWPFIWLYLFWLAGGIGRSQAMYWVGRGAHWGVGRTRFSRMLSHKNLERARRAIERWGMPIVPAAFLTIGFQSAVQVTAGMLRISWLRYSLWTIPGALVWAAIYTTGTTAVVWALLKVAATNPWIAGALALIGAGAIAFAVWRKRTRRADDAGDDTIEVGGEAE